MWEKTQWIDDAGSAVSIIELIKRLKDVPVIYMDLKAIRMSKKVTINPVKKAKADLSYFVILEHDNRLLDGYHRVAKSIEIGMSHIPAKILRGPLHAYKH